MATTGEIAASFDARAGSYARNEWHRRCAERLVELCQLRSGQRVLDAGTGTGFVALAAARNVGSEGAVVGVDVSQGMLKEAHAAVVASRLLNIELVEDDATQMPHLADESFDAIVCAAGLLYMPVAAALQEWHRLLRPGGLVAFSTMKAGSPPGGRIFRECARQFGLSLKDPSEALGSDSACRRALASAGFEVPEIVAETVEFSTQDLTLAWESNSRSEGHADVQRLSPDAQEAFREAYLSALARDVEAHPDAHRHAEILYATGRKAVGPTGD